MPVNVFLDLTKSEVVEQLKKLRCGVNSVHELNLVMEEMGLIEHVGNSWLTTKKGLEYSMFKVRMYDAKEWHPSLIRAVYTYLSDNGKLPR